jgi:DNA-binding NarL/FixJ family response regulator
MKKVFIIDDHSLLSQSLEMLINKFDDYNVTFIGQNGSELIHRLLDTSLQKPDIILLDIKMPIMGGLETMDWIYKNQPELNVIALTMEDDETTIIQMLKKGVKGYLLKDLHPDILHKAMNEVLEHGFFQTDKVSKILLQNLNIDNHKTVVLKDKELEFIKLACTEMTYKEIADTMNLSPKTIDGYREHLFLKLDLKSRVGLVMYAIRHKLYQI